VCTSCKRAIGAATLCMISWKTNNILSFYPEDATSSWGDPSGPSLTFSGTENDIGVSLSSVQRVEFDDGDGWFLLRKFGLLLGEDLISARTVASGSLFDGSEPGWKGKPVLFS
jgi:hypothetical protein